MLSMMYETHLPSLSKVIMKVRYNGEIQKGKAHITTIRSDQSARITGGPELIKIEENNLCYIKIENCSPCDIKLERGSTIATVETEWEDQIQEFDGKQVDNFINEIKDTAAKIQKPVYLIRADIEKRVKMNILAAYKEKYLDLLFKYRHVISKNKSDLGMANNFFHRIILKDNGPVYRKLYQIPEAHTSFIEETLTEWLKLGVVRRSQSRYNSPIFCVPKKTGQGIGIIQDFRELNEHSHIDKYSMKEVNKCIGNIGSANSMIFTTLDLTSGFWQMPLHQDNPHKTAFTIPGKVQFKWITSPMGLLRCLALFQQMMEKFMRGIPNAIGYIDDLLIHSKTHEEHLDYLEQVLKRLGENHMKLNIKKCFFGNTEVSYLRLVLMPKGIKPGRDKLKAIKAAQPPTDMKTVRSFIGLCNFFWTHIKNFSKVSAPLTKITRKDSGYNGGPLPKEAIEAVVAYPRSDSKYVLITDASTGTDTIVRGFGAVLTQVNEKKKYCLRFTTIEGPQIKLFTIFSRDGSC